MLSVKLDPDVERLLEHEVDDLARYNILRYLHDNPGIQGDVIQFSEELGLRSPERVEDALEALTRCGLLEREPSGAEKESRYGLSTDPVSRDLVDRLYRLSLSEEYGEIVERLAARSLHRARKALAAARSGRKNGHRLKAS